MAIPAGSHPALAQAKSLAFHQLFIRLFTFVGNAIVARHLGPASFGVASVHLPLAATLTLSLARDGLRKAVMRISGNKNIERAIINQTWMHVAASIPILTSAVLIVSQLAEAPSMALLSVFGVSALLEMIGEPLHALAFHRIETRMRVYADILAASVRCIVLWMLASFGLWSLAMAQFAYALTLTGTMIIAHGSLPLPGLIFDKELRRYTYSFSVQAAEKLLLAEGEKLAMLAAGVPSEQHGIYNMVVNVGSLVCRLLLQPLEESAYAEFGLLFSDHNITQHTLRACGETLAVLLKLAISASLLLVAIGPSYTHTFFLLLYGTKWAHTDAPNALALYFGCIFLMAINGLTEAFVFATMSHKELSRYNVWLVVFSGGYLAVCTALLPWGVYGMMLANAANMACRVAYSCTFIAQMYKRITTMTECFETVKLALPTRTFIAVLGLSSAICAFSAKKLANEYAQQSNIFLLMLMHIVVGGVCTVTTLLALYYSDRAFVQRLQIIFVPSKCQTQKLQ